MKRNKTPVVEIELEEGKIRHLRFDYNAQAEILDLGYEPEDLNFTNIVEEVEGEDGQKRNKYKKGALFLVRDAIWAALAWEDRTLTPVMVGQLFSEVGMDYVYEKLLAMVAATKAPQEALPLAESQLPASE